MPIEARAGACAHGPSTGVGSRRNGEKWAKVFDRKLVDGRGENRISAGEWRHVLRFEPRDD